MNFNEHFLQVQAEELNRSRMASAAYYRAGGESPIVRLVGAAAASLERVAAAVRRWAREPVECNSGTHRSALVRH